PGLLALGNLAWVRGRNFDDRRLESSRGEPGVSTGLIAIDQFEIPFLPLMGGQIPTDFLGQIISWRRRLLEDRVVRGQAKPDQVFFANWFVREAIVSCQKKGQPSRNGKRFGAENAGEIFAVGQAGEKRAGFVPICGRPLLHGPWIGRSG